MAAVAEKIDPVENCVAHEINLSTGMTNIVSNRLRTAALPAPQEKTEISGNTASKAIISTDARPQLRSQMTFPAAAKKIDGVIGEILPEAVIVHVRLNGNTLDLSLPPSLFPPDLMIYGATIEIALDNSLGYRRPVVSPRTISPQPQLEGVSTITDWLQAN